MNAEDRADMECLENVPLAPFTTLRIGGRARFFIRVTRDAELAEALRFAREQGLPHFVLGGGSNLLVADDGFAGVVIRMETRGIVFESDGDNVRVTAHAGELWDRLVAETVRHEAWGLENLSLIPGTVGAAPVQNIGAYGAEVKDCIESVSVFDAASGTEQVLANRDCRFGYRESLFKTPAGKPLIVRSVTFRLSHEANPNLTYPDLRRHFGAEAAPTQTEIRTAVIDIRRAKFPDLERVGTAGSFWKNPVIATDEYTRLASTYPGLPAFAVANGKVKVPLAWILDRICGLRGYRRGDVALFENQPLVLVTDHGARSASVSAFDAEVRALIKARTGLDVEPEVRRVPAGANSD